VKLAFVFPPGLLNGRTLDFTNLLGDKRGTTGSEIVALAFPSEMAARGHDVTLFVEKFNADGYSLKGKSPVTLRQFMELRECSSQYDAVLAVCIMNDVDLFQKIDPRCVRVCFQQVNDFKFASKGFQDFVDIFIAPSAAEVEYLKPWPIDPKKWIVIPNGCYPEDYLTDEKVPGRCVYLSSPDRGLHNLLEQWGAIKSAIPYAELKIFYHGLQEYLSAEQGDRRHVPRIESIKRHLNQPGVTVCGAVSRAELARELSEAETLTFPVDCLDWTESFSCATLEGCASGALPIIVGADAMGDIYKGAVPTVPPPARDHLDEWTALVIRALTVPPWTESWRRKARTFAEMHAWPVLAEKLEKEIEEHARRKRA
jgi:glycosyltransferase involved in cell wall biosynthesis